MQNRKARTIAIIVFFLIGLAIVLYPTIANKWNEYRASKLFVSYDDAVAEADNSQLEYELERAKAYNEALVPKTVPDAFAVREGLSDEEYESLLNINGDGMMGYVEIPVIDVKIPIYHYTTDDVLQKGAGHLFGSALPVGGNGTHSVISAHRGLPSAKLFTDLNLVEIGDHFMIHILGETFTYEVDQIDIVEPTDTEVLSPSTDLDLVTLMTCTPYGVNSHRLLVQGHRVPNDTEITETADLGRMVKNNFWSIIIRILCVLAGIALAFGAVKLGEFMRKKRSGEEGAADEELPEETKDIIHGRDEEKEEKSE